MARKWFDLFVLGVVLLLILLAIFLIPLFFGSQDDVLGTQVRVREHVVVEVALDSVLDLDGGIVDDGFVVRRGTFVGGDSFHNAKGVVMLAEEADGSLLLFGDFVVTMDSFLKVYLAKDLEAEEFVDLGDLKSVQGSFRYEIDSSVEVSEYDKVLIWSEPFGVLFGYAVLE